MEYTNKASLSLPPNVSERYTEADTFKCQVCNIISTINLLQKKIDPLCEYVTNV